MPAKNPCNELLFEAARKGDLESAQVIISGAKEIDAELEKVNNCVKKLGVKLKTFAHSQPYETFNIDARDDKGFTALQYAAFNGLSSKLVALLVENDASATMSQSLLYALSAKQSISSLSVTDSKKDDKTANEIIQILLEKKADIELTYNSGFYLYNTPLHAAAVKNYPLCIKTLMNWGANPHVFNQDSRPKDDPLKPAGFTTDKNCIDSLDKGASFWHAHQYFISKQPTLSKKIDQKLQYRLDNFAKLIHNLRNCNSGEQRGILDQHIFDAIADAKLITKKSRYLDALQTLAAWANDAQEGDKIIKRCVDRYYDALKSTIGYEAESWKGIIAKSLTTQPEKKAQPKAQPLEMQLLDKQHASPISQPNSNTKDKDEKKEKNIEDDEDWDLLVEQKTSNRSHVAAPTKQ